MDISYPKEVAIASFPNLINIQVRVAEIAGVEGMETYTAKTLKTRAISTFQLVDDDETFIGERSAWRTRRAHRKKANELGPKRTRIATIGRTSSRRAYGQLPYLISSRDRQGLMR